MWLQFIAIILLNGRIYCTESDRVEDKKEKIVCYYYSWTHYWAEPWNFNIENIPGHLCTHIIYVFVGLNDQSWELNSIDPKYDLEKGYGYRSFTDLKKKYPHLKCLFSMGGWAQGGHVYSNMVADLSKRNTFVRSVVKWIQDFDFDGLDLYWQYPGDLTRGGSTDDKTNYWLLVQELRDAFKPHGLLLSGMMPISKSLLVAGYEVSKLAGLFDWINVLTHDLRGYWNGFADVPSPLNGRPSDRDGFVNSNVNDGLKLLVEMGVPKKKLLVGIPFFGKTYTLANENDTEIGNAVSAAGHAGHYSTDPGILTYFEICYQIKSGILTRKFDTVGKCPYAYHDNQWIGYEDEESISFKMDHLKEEGYGGAMVWTINMDDYNGNCGRKNALLQVINDKLKKNPLPSRNESIKLVSKASHLSISGWWLLRLSMFTVIVLSTFVL